MTRLFEKWCSLYSRIRVAAALMGLCGLKRSPDPSKNCPLSVTLSFAHLQRSVGAAFWFFPVIEHVNRWDSSVMKLVDFIDPYWELATRLNVVFLAPGKCREWPLGCCLCLQIQNGSFLDRSKLLLSSPRSTRWVTAALCRQNLQC